MITKAVTTKAHNLCVYSMTTGGVNVGITWPLQRGQSGQASWEPVEVTTPPRTISMYTEAAEARESALKAAGLTAKDLPRRLVRATS